MEPDEKDQRRRSRMQVLHECAAGTPMGALLRTFWQPVARSETVKAGEAKPIRILSEDLTLYRGESGTAYLVGGQCAHRRTVMHTGWVEGEQIRCMYHGWRYDGAGRATQIPAEPKPRNEMPAIAGYPVQEYAGLVFAYLGAGAPPSFDLSRKHFLDEPGRHNILREQVWDCNWFQQIENSLDAVHVSFVHVWGKFSRYGEEITTAIPELSYTETESGIRQEARRSAANVRFSDWTFPNNNHVVIPGQNKGEPWSHLTVWVVPVDEYSTARFTIYSFDPSATELAERFRNGPDRDFNPADHHDRLFAGSIPEGLSNAEVLASQDYVALRGQGRIADRTLENLSSSDLGITLLRRIFFREMDAMREGRPTKAWGPLREALDMPIPRSEPAMS